MPKKEFKIKNIIWDLSGTLFKPSAKNLRTNQRPLYSLLFYLWSGKKTTNKYDRIAIDILTKTMPSSKKREVILLHTGKQVPEIVCLWLSGIIDSDQAYKKTLICYKKIMLNRAGPAANLNNKDKLLIKNMIWTLFNPQALADVMQPVIPMVNILKKCSNQNYNFFILSNWDLESFDILYKTKKGQRVFKYFNKQNIIISGQTGYMKPQKEIYEYFLKKTMGHIPKIKLRSTSPDEGPHDTLFIDDQLENLQEAKKFGIMPIHFEHNNAKKVLNELLRYKIIK